MNDGTGLSARPDVRAFYNSGPFNLRELPERHAASLRAGNSLLDYPPLVAALADRPRVLDVGCGTGWLVNGVSLRYGCPAHGIDVSTVAIERARSVASLVGAASSFEVVDLFAYRPQERFGLVTSLGVLHHTDDCQAALTYLGELFVADDGAMLIGLYHAWGRRPFLAHFEAMRRHSAGEEAMFAAFRRLWRGTGRSDSDEALLRSWFQDQVLHPHETSHTLCEFLPLLDSLGFEIVSTSINRFGPPPKRETLPAMEKQLEQVGRKALAEGRYYPGFFVFMARRRYSPNLLTSRSVPDATHQAHARPLPRRATGARRRDGQSAGYPRCQHPTV